MENFNDAIGFHDRLTADLGAILTWNRADTQFTYTFRNFFHPFVGELIARLNQDSLAGMFDPAWQESLKTADPQSDPAHDFFRLFYQPRQGRLVRVESFPKEIETAGGGAYAAYNWELFFHIPLTVAVHLSKNGRFAEAQRWFHYIFDPAWTDPDGDPPRPFWKFLAFRREDGGGRVEDILRTLSTPRADLPPDGQSRQDEIMNGYDAIRRAPFQPHAVARTRPVAYQYSVVMKYLDNLIAWGDQLFRQDTVESINEATQIYVLASNVLGERPQQVPTLGRVKARTFAQLKQAGLGPVGDALVDLEGQFPFNLAAPDSGADAAGNGGDADALFGIGRTLYFCLPRNDKLLAYWDTGADRLFKIRHCMDIAGGVRPLALFDPPLDPGLLVRAAAARMYVESMAGGSNQPVGPVRSLTLIEKALELCGELRALGGTLLSALEKNDAEHLALMRQRHEVRIQAMSQEVRFLQWKSAQEATASLLTGRAAALERLRYYQRLLGLPADPEAPDDLALDRTELTEENFDDAYAALVGQYDRKLTLQKLADLKLAGNASPSQQVGASGAGRLYLNANEDNELNRLLPRARDLHLAAGAANLLAASLTPVPTVNIDAHFWGIGMSSEVTGGKVLSAAAKFLGDAAEIAATWEQEQAGMAGRAAGYERRADEWVFQHNLAAHEIMQVGRSILNSLLAEQTAHREYLNARQEVADAQEVNDFLLQGKFTNEDLYLWMQGESFRLYQEYYRFAFDTARRAERAMKQELLRPELDSQDLVKPGGWDGGRKGLLCGEALYLDVKRMEMTYHDCNRRELELTKHVSLRQLDPLSLLMLKTVGTCRLTIPEWLYDMDCPGHYLRRIRTVALSVPSVVGPYTGVYCTLSLLGSSLRKSPLAADDYARQGAEDDRFVDYAGAVQSVVTSGANYDGGTFETNLHDERFLPFEGAGAVSTWKLELPTNYPAFDHATVSDVILHVRYTARQGVDAAKVVASLDAALQPAGEAGLALLFHLRYEFPSEWAAFVNGAAPSNLSAVIRRDHFPYFTRDKAITVTGVDLYALDGNRPPVHRALGDPAAWDAATADLNDAGKRAFAVNATEDGGVLTRAADAQVFLIVRYAL